MTLALAILTAAYLWSRRSMPSPLSPARAAAFVGGIVTLWAATASPLAEADHARLTAHMVQHLLIMTVAAPLVLLGEPGRVFARGAPLRLFAPHPVACWAAGTLVVLFWHVPSVFAVGMRRHGLQQATFLVAGLLFWLPVIQPYPTRLRWSRWSIPLYLCLATMPCDALSAFLVFCGRLVYPHYGALHAGGLAAALDDQQSAGALMWFWVTVAYLAPAALVTLRLLSPAVPRPAQSRP